MNHYSLKYGDQQAVYYASYPSFDSYSGCCHSTCVSVGTFGLRLGYHPLIYRQRSFTPQNCHFCQGRCYSDTLAVIHCWGGRPLSKWSDAGVTCLLCVYRYEGQSTPLRSRMSPPREQLSLNGEYSSNAPGHVVSTMRIGSCSSSTFHRNCHLANFYSSFS